MKNGVKYIEELCYTSDEWYPNIDGDKVKVGMYINDKIKEHCVSVWGDDDDGMEFWSKDKGKIRELYKRVIGLKDVTKDVLKKLGFYQA